LIIENSIVYSSKEKMRKMKKNQLFEVKYNMLSGWYVLDLQARPVTMHGAYEGIHNYEDAQAFADKMNAKFSVQ